MTARFVKWGVIMKKITSRTNPRLKYARTLHRSRQRKKEGKFLVEGVRLLEEAVESENSIETIFFTKRLLTKARGQNLVKECRRRGSECFLVPEAVLVSLADTDSPQGIIGIAPISLWERNDLLTGPGLLLLVDRVRDPGNLGTMLRTAEAAGSAGAFLSVGTVDPYNAKALRASMGSIFRFPLQLDCNLPALVAELKKIGYRTLAADADGEVTYWEADFSSPGALIVGNEAWGVARELLDLADARVKIPLSPGVESLNAALAAGILLYEGVRRRFIK